MPQATKHQSKKRRVAVTPEELVMVSREPAIPNLAYTLRHLSPELQETSKRIEKLEEDS